MPTENAEVSFRQLVTSLNIASQIAYAPISGRIRRITVSWPAGCNFLVEVIFRHKRMQFIPTPARGANQGIALDNFTETLNPNRFIEQNDPIEMHLINHDNTNAHTISAIVHIEETDENNKPEKGQRPVCRT